MYNTLRNSRQIIRESPYAEAVEAPRKRKERYRVSTSNMGRVNNPSEAVVPSQYQTRYGTNY